MKTTTIVRVVTVAGMLFVSSLSANAQFFKKLGKAIEKTAKTVESTANALDEVSKAADATPSTASSLTDSELQLLLIQYPLLGIRFLYSQQSE